MRQTTSDFVAICPDDAGSCSSDSSEGSSATDSSSEDDTTSSQNLQRRDRHRPRSRSESWQKLPQEQRGIALGELWTLHDAHKGWLREPRWRCSVCHKSASSQGHQAICEHPGCGCLEGKLQMRNLYEVVEVIIRPACQRLQCSYVELLSRSHKNRRPGREVDTFVSHWWGEEFPFLIKSLDRYSRVSCSAQRRWLPALLLGTLAAIAYPLLLTIFHEAAAACIWDTLKAAIYGIELEGEKTRLCLLWAFADAVVTLSVFFAAASLSKRAVPDHMSRSYWICAFANNQFAIEHALAVEGDLDTSAFAIAMMAPTCRSVVAVLDSAGEIYRRIWCGFELFFATEVLPRKCGRQLPVSLLNEDGVLSHGDGSLQAVRTMGRLIREVSISEAKASVDADRVMIFGAMRRAGTSCEDLDQVLRGVAENAEPVVRWRRWAPMVIFSTAPAGMAALSLSTFWFCLYRSFPEFARQAYPMVWDAAWICLGIFAGCLLSLGCCFCCGSNRLRKNEALGRACKRSLGAMSMIGVPTLVACCAVMVAIESGCSYAYVSKTIEMFGVAVVSNLALACFGFLAGLLFAASRDLRWLFPLRTWLDDLLFS